MTRTNPLHSGQEQHHSTGDAEPHELELFSQPSANSRTPAKTTQQPETLALNPTMIKRALEAGRTLRWPTLHIWRHSHVPAERDSWARHIAQCVPEDLDALVETAEELVWTQAMTKWLPALDVHGLTNPSSASAILSSSSGTRLRKKLPSAQAPPYVIAPPQRAMPPSRSCSLQHPGQHSPFMATSTSAPVVRQAGRSFSQILIWPTNSSRTSSKPSRYSRRPTRRQANSPTVRTLVFLPPHAGVGSTTQPGGSTLRDGDSNCTTRGHHNRHE